MIDEANEEVGRRKNLPRAGLTALNLIAPGLGIARLGNWRLAAPFLLAPFVLIALVTFGMGHFPITSYDGALFALLLLLGLLAVYPELRSKASNHLDRRGKHAKS